VVIVRADRAAKTWGQCYYHSFLLLCIRGCQIFSWYNRPKWGKIYQISIKYLCTPNGRKQAQWS
jgi:hypothetical protein